MDILSKYTICQPRETEWLKLLQGEYHPKPSSVPGSAAKAGLIKDPKLSPHPSVARANISAKETVSAAKVPVSQAKVPARPAPRSQSVKGKAREPRVHYVSDEEDIEIIVPRTPTQAALLKQNIKSLTHLLVPQSFAAEVAKMANSLTAIAPDYATLSPEIHKQLLTFLGNGKDNPFLPPLECALTALVFVAYPPDESLPNAGFIRMFPLASIDTRLFNFLSLAVSGHSEEAQRITSHILYKNDDFKPETMITIIEAALHTRNQYTIRAVAHAILALRRLTKWEHDHRFFYSSSTALKALIHIIERTTVRRVPSALTKVRLHRLRLAELLRPHRLELAQRQRQRRESLCLRHAHYVNHESA